MVFAQQPKLSNTQHAATLTVFSTHISGDELLVPPSGQNDHEIGPNRISPLKKCIYILILGCPRKSVNG